MEQKPNVLPLRLEDVSYQYEPDARPAVSHVTLAVERGSFVAVLGHNGSGKSTLAKLMNALFLPTEGRVLVCGMDTLTEEKVWNIRRHAGMVFQNPDNQIVANVVREDVAFGLENLGVPQDEMVRRVEAALSAVRMSEFAETAPHMPPMAALAQTLRERGMPLPEGILTVSDMVKELKNVLCPSK